MAEFIKLTGQYSRKPIYVRIDVIVCVASGESFNGGVDGGTAVCFPGSEENIIYVEESPDAVMKIIAEKSKEDA